MFTSLFLTAAVCCGDTSRTRRATFACVAEDVVKDGGPLKYHRNDLKGLFKMIVFHENVTSDEVLVGKRDKVLAWRAAVSLWPLGAGLRS